MFNQLLETGLGHELAGQLVGPDDRLVLGCGICGNGDYSFKEIAGRGLRGGRLVWGEEGYQMWDKVLLLQPLCGS